VKRAWRNREDGFIDSLGSVTRPVERPREHAGRLLNHESGLLGLAGSSHVRELLLRSDEAARTALDIFYYRILKYVGAYLTILGGAEAIVFTGGIEENSPEIRRRVCQGLKWLGLEVDEVRNARSEECISSRASRLAAYAIRTDEESVIAREAHQLQVPTSPPGGPAGPR
jgi:acetate kinase